MKRLFYSVIIAAFAMLSVSCEKENVPNTGDETGTLYGTWILDTKTIDIVSNSSGKTDKSSDKTDFKGENFMLKLTDFYMAFAQKGSLATFDIDDVDGTPYSYNAGLKQISFENSISLSSGFPLIKKMTLYGTYDVVVLSDTNLVLRKIDEVKINSYSTTTTTVYSYHRYFIEPETEE